MNSIIKLQHLRLETIESQEVAAADLAGDDDFEFFENPQISPARLLLNQMSRLSRNASLKQRSLTAFELSPYKI